MNCIYRPVSYYGTDLDESYTVNMPDNHKQNPTDVFFCNLLEIDPMHLHYVNQTDRSEDEPTEIRQFIDPRTRIEIPSHECNYKNINFEIRNIFLTRSAEVSTLHRDEHSACLKAMRLLSKPEADLSTDEKTDRAVFDSTATARSEESKSFLAKLKEHFFSQLSNRYHSVPPAVDYFIVQRWKINLVLMYRRFANVKYQIRTAIALQSSECMVDIGVVHQESMGIVPKMSVPNTNFIRQSFANLSRAYNRRKNTCLLPAIKRKVEELNEIHGIDIVIPISIIKAILSCEKNWCFCVTIEGSELNEKNKMHFDKPMPRNYLSGNQRYRKGAKYLLHSCLNQNSSNVYNYDEQTETETFIASGPIENSSHVNTDIEYKLMDNEECGKKYSRREKTYENISFRVFDINAFDPIDGSTETSKVLVPAKQAAYMKDDSGEMRFVNFSPKIEYQFEFGAEVMSKDELIREWCDLYFRPNTITERGNNYQEDICKQPSFLHFFTKII